MLKHQSYRKSTVGAGDSLLAGMIHGLVNQLPPEETLKTATAIASHAVTQIGFRILLLRF